MIFGLFGGVFWAFVLTAICMIVSSLLLYFIAYINNIKFSFKHVIFKAFLESWLFNSIILFLLGSTYFTIKSVDVLFSIWIIIPILIVVVSCIYIRYIRFKQS